jgi:RNA polymerase sigma factor (sigma-70 family)
LRQILQLVDRHAPEAVADAAILKRYVQQGDEAAFESLVARHARLVWNVCRRVVADETDAEDVFQATFLVLARRAAKVRHSASVGSWLYGVAWRLAHHARASAARRSWHERRAVRSLLQDSAADVTWREMRTLLDEELARLPETLRAPLLLCYFEGLTQDEAARQLGWKLRTVKARVQRGRHRLKVRLSRRGVTLSAALVAPMLAADAAVPGGLTASSARAAVSFAAGRPGPVSPSAVELASASMVPVFARKLNSVFAAFLLVAALGVGTRFLLGRATDPGKKPEPPAAQPATATDLVGDPLPPGATARMGTLRFRSDGFGPSSLDFLPDSKTLVTTEYRHGIRFWDAATGRVLRTLKTEPLSVRGFALSSDGKHAAVGGFLPDEGNKPTVGEVRVLDLSTGKTVQTWPRTDADVDICSLALSPDGKLLFSLGRHGIVRIEEVATGVELLRQQFGRDNSNCFALSSDGSTLAISTGPNGRKLFVWRWQAGEEPRELKPIKYGPASLAFSSDGTMLAEAGDDFDGVSSVWDVASGKLVRRLKSPNGRDRLSHVCFSPDGKLLAISETGNTVERHWNGAVTLWDTATGKFLRQLPTPGESAGRLAFSADSHMLAATGASGFHVWDVRTGVDAAANDAAHVAMIDDISIAANGLVATASRDHTTRLWDLTSGRLLRKITSRHWMLSAALSPDGSRLVTSGLSDEVCLWDANSGELIYSLPGHGRMGGKRSVAFTRDGKRFVSFGDDFYLRVWDATNGKALREHAVRPTGVNVPGEDDDPQSRERRLVDFMLDKIALSPDGKLLVVATMKDLHLFDVDTGKEIVAIPNEGAPIWSVAIANDGKYLLAGASGKSEMIRLTDRRMRGTVPKENPVCLWELPSGRLVKRISLADRQNGPVAFSADGKYFATATEKPEFEIVVREVPSCTPVKTFTGFGSRACALAFSPDGRHLVAALWDTSALVFDLGELPARAP